MPLIEYYKVCIILISTTYQVWNNQTIRQTRTFKEKKEWNYSLFAGNTLSNLLPVEIWMVKKTYFKYKIIFKY